MKHTEFVFNLDGKNIKEAIEAMSKEMQEVEVQHRIFNHHIIADFDDAIVTIGFGYFFDDSPAHNEILSCDIFVDGKLDATIFEETGRIKREVVFKELEKYIESNEVDLGLATLHELSKIIQEMDKALEQCELELFR